VEWDEDGLDDEPAPPLLPPEDRLWRHPSEVAGAPALAVRGQTGATAGSSGARVVTVAVLASCISMLMTVGVVSVVRPFRTRVPVEPGPGRTDVDAAAPVGADVAALTARLRPAITQIVARLAGGERRWGSGVVFRSDGLVLTTHHIVHGAEVVRVILDDGRDLTARVVGSDADTDIAVLDVEGDGFVTAPLASRRSAAGEPAITIGTPSGGASTGPLVRVSMVSAVGQEAGVEGRRFVDMIRTDAALAAGCSGGAVVDEAGDVIGIAVSNVTTEDGAAGFATPIDVARSVADQLVASGKVTRGWLGIDGETTDGGALVRAVKAASPAESAGLQVDDVVVAVDGATIDSMPDLVMFFRHEAPGRMVDLSVRRGGEVVHVLATLGEQPVSA
jgi:S1-C subfamily serine protease